MMGVYRLYHAPTDTSFIGFTHYMEGTRKRLKFELALNACSYKHLQAFYDEHGGDVQFEVLEEYEADFALSDEEIDAHLMAILLRYKEKLHAKLIQI